MLTMQDTKRTVQTILCDLAKARKRYVPAAVSGRHVHLSKEHIETLFGKDHCLMEKKPLSQPGQFACEETIELVGNKGSIQNVRVLGPARKETQVEISLTDSYLLGIPPVVRMSGDLKGTPGGMLLGPCGKVELKTGVIVAKRHLHISEEQARAYGLSDKDVIDVQTFSNRPIVFKDILVRSGEGHDLELHLDMDEANAAAIKNGDYLEIV